jgi:hypothetical protein
MPACAHSAVGQIQHNLIHGAGTEAFDQIYVFNHIGGDRKELQNSTTSDLAKLPMMSDLKSFALEGRDLPMLKFNCTKIKYESFNLL